MGIVSNIRTRLAYRVPLLHALICLTALLGSVVPRISFLMGALFVLFWLDLPVSLLALWFSMDNRETIAILCLLILGTPQWYVYARGIEMAINRFRRGAAKPGS